MVRMTYTTCLVTLLFKLSASCLADTCSDGQLQPLNRCYAYVSVGDNRFALGWQPVDSPATINALFEMAAETYKVRRMYWREERAWARHYKIGTDSPAQGPLIYDYTQRWAPYLDNVVKVNKLAIAAARRHDMGIYMVRGLFDHGVQPDVGVLLPYLFEDRLRIEHPQWCSLDRWGERRQPGPIDFCYPAARRALVAQYVSDVTREGYDGLALYTYVENFGYRYADETGFNTPIVREFQRRYGVDIRREPFDKEAWYRLRGEYLTQFLRELHAALAAQRKKLCIHISPENPHFGHAWYATFEVARGLTGAGKVYLDWETWAREGIVDELLINWLGDQKALARQMLEVCRDKPLELTIYSTLPYGEHHGYAADWAPFLEAGITPVIELSVHSAWSVGRMTLQPTSVEGLTSPDWRMRVQSLADIADGKFTADSARVAVLAKDPHVLVRRQALLTLGALKASQQVTTLEAGLKDAESSVRHAAAFGLAGAYGPKSAALLVQALQHDDQVQMRQACVHSLVNMGEQARPVLLAGLTAASVWVREVCIRSLGLDGSPEARKPLLHVLRYDQDYRARYWAVEAIARYPDQEVARALLVALNDPSVTVQLIAAERLGRRVDQLSPLVCQRVREALEARFREYGDGCLRPDAAYGWRIIGNALAACGAPGHAALEALCAQRKDRWLAWIAYEVIHVPQSADRVLLCEEADAIATHAKFAPPFPGWRHW